MRQDVINQKVPCVWVGIADTILAYQIGVIGLAKLFPRSDLVLKSMAEFTGSEVFNSRLHEASGNVAVMQHSDRGGGVANISENACCREVAEGDVTIDLISVVQPELTRVERDLMSCSRSQARLRSRVHATTEPRHRGEDSQVR